jgi:hypothetical protein
MSRWQRFLHGLGLKVTDERLCPACAHCRHRTACTVCQCEYWDARWESAALTETEKP